MNIKNLILLITISFSLLFIPSFSLAYAQGCSNNFPSCSSAGDSCYRGCGCPSSPGCTSGGYTWNGLGNTNCLMEKTGSPSKSCGCYLASCGSNTGNPGGNTGGEGVKSNIGDKVKDLMPINTSLGDFISNSVSAIILVAGLATFLYLIWGGIEWISSGGEKDKIEGSKQKITNAIIGLAIVAAAWAIYLLVDFFFGIGIVG